MRIATLLAGATALCVSACSRPTAEPGDAGAPTVATLDGGRGTASAGSAAVATSAPAAAGVAVAATGGPFQGSFPGCFTGGLKTSQSGVHVLGHSGDSSDQKVAHDVINFSCNVAGDDCTGTATTVTKSETGKITPKGPPRKMKFTRAADGTFQFSLDGQAAPSPCGKPG